MNSSAEHESAKTLKHFFDSDFPFMNIAGESSLNIGLPGANTLVSFHYHLNFNFDNKTCFFSYYVPKIQYLLLPAVHAIAQSARASAEHVLRSYEITQKTLNGITVSTSEFEFSSEVFVYCDGATTEEVLALTPILETLNLKGIIRSDEYACGRKLLERVIPEFLQEYASERPLYLESAKSVQQKLEGALREAGILAWVTSRVKSIDSLREKLWQRVLPFETGKQYKNCADIYADVVDLVGIRIALYFPSDRDKVGHIIQHLFPGTNPPQIYTGGKKPPSYERRFSGYWATHYRLHIKVDSQKSIRAEVQIASIAMHAWAEVEHDLQYKQKNGELWREEVALLDQLNGLMLSGEMVLEQLNVARAKRLATIKKYQNDLRDEIEKKKAEHQNLLETADEVK